MPAPINRGFSERVAVITDADTAVGRAVALQLAMQGCYVIAGFSTKTANSKNALEELQAIGTLASAVETDVAALAGVAKLFETVEAAYGRLDLLVNSANFESRIDFLNVGENDFIEAVDKNLKAAFFCSQAAVKLMQNRPAPAIVNLVIETEHKKNALFAAAQASLAGFSAALAVELAPKIRVNCVSWNTDDAPQAEFSLLRPQSGVAPNDVARTVVYLLSSEAAALTGQTISVGAKRARI